MNELIENYNSFPTIWSEVAPIQIHAWKKALIEGASELLGKGNGKKDDQTALVDRIYRQIGQLTVENDFGNWLSFSTRVKVVHGPESL